MAKDKGVMVSFRVDRHLADVLKKVPDKSSFIRDIILKSFYETCPVCRGRGVLPTEISRWAVKLLRAEKVVECICCHHRYPPASLPRRKKAEPRKKRFICPHCQSHEHAH